MIRGPLWCELCARLKGSELNEDMTSIGLEDR